MPPTGFEPGNERPQTHALDLAATGIGFGKEYLPVNHKYNSYVLLSANLLYHDYVCPGLLFSAQTFQSR